MISCGLDFANDGTSRDCLRHDRFNVTQGKIRDSSGFISFWLVPVLIPPSSMPPLSSPA